MSQGFTAINVPPAEETVFSQVVAVEAPAGAPLKQEDMEVENELVGADEAPEQASNTTKRRAPKAQQPAENGTPATKTPRKNSKAKATNEDGTPVAVTKPTAARKKATPKVDEEGNPIPKTPRRKAEPKPKLGSDGEALPKTPRKASAKKTKSQPKVEDNETDDREMIDNVAAANGANPSGDSASSYCPPTPEGYNSPTNGALDPTTPKVKKSPVKTRLNGTPGGVPVTPGSKKRAVNEDGDNSAFMTPTKKTKVIGTPKSGNGKGMAIATSIDQLSAEDKMLIEYKKENRSWADIREMWVEMTGKSVGGSTLPNRFARNMANLTNWKDGDIERMLFAKEQVTKSLAEEIEATRKKLEGDLFNRISTMMVELGADTYSAAAIEKAYGKEKREGFPHQSTINQVINGEGSADDFNKDADMEDAETPEEGSSDGGVPLLAEQSLDAKQEDQNGVDPVIKEGSADTDDVQDAV